jgi:hypothetical protein
MAVGTISFDIDIDWMPERKTLLESRIFHRFRISLSHNRMAEIAVSRYYLSAFRFE